MKKLRIAQFVTNEVPYPIPKNFWSPYAPIGLSVKIAKILSQKGHEVTYYGPNGSKSSDNSFKIKDFNIDPFYKNKILKDKNTSIAVRARIKALLDQYSIAHIFFDHLKGPFDIIHFHLSAIDHALMFTYLFSDINIVFTLHDPISLWRQEMLAMFQSENRHLVSISDAQRKAPSKLKFFATVYNGVDLNYFPFSPKIKDYLLVAGRLISEKGIHESIEVAKESNRQLLIAGPIEKGEANREYWETKIKPYLNNQIKHIGFIPREKLYRYYQQAKVFLMSIMWEEPFGLVVPEANACGTPVVAFARGSMPELIKDGYNGFLVKPGDVKAMAKAVQRIYDMPEEEYRQMRQNCRRHVEENFTVEKMVDNYEKVYYKIVEERSKHL